MTSQQKKLDTLYERLLDTYINKTSDEYVRERKIVADRLTDESYDFSYKLCSLSRV